MATSSVVVNVVDIGQGQCTFIEVWNDETVPKLIHTVLIDCGSDKKSDDAEVNLTYIKNQVELMDDPTFDCIIFSHSDKDHISLTKELLQKFTTKPKVKKVWYGGAWDKYLKKTKTTEFNILDFLEEEDYCDKEEIATTGSNYTGYSPDDGKFTHYLWRSDDKSVHVYPIVSNVLSDDPDWDSNDEDVEGKKAEELNRVSIICGVYFNSECYVICGDATHKTMGSVGNLFIGGTTVFKTNRMTTMPHHGSRSTGFAVPSAKKASDEAKLVVKTFANILKSQTLTISAYEKHRHPSLELMNCFIPTLADPFLRDWRLKQKNAHRLTAYYDVKLKRKNDVSVSQNSVYSFDTMTCTFSTRYSRAKAQFYYNLGGTTVAEADGVVKVAKVEIPINEFACWMYTTKSTGECIVNGYSSFRAPLSKFTKDAEALAVPRPSGLRSAIGAEDDEPVEHRNNDAPPLVMTRIKTSAPARQPSQSRPQLNARLKQFH